jgi:cutinase
VTASLVLPAAAGLVIALTLAHGGSRDITSKPAALDFAGTATAGTATAGPAAEAAASASTAAASPAAKAAASTGTSCPDVNVVFARGTLELPGLGIVGTPFASAVSADLPHLTVTDYAVNYTADITQDSAGPGATDMSEHIISVAAQCPNTRFIIGGYSQGATVTDIALGIQTILGTGTTIPASIAPRIAAVVTFGNPLRLTGQTIASASPANAAKSDDFCEQGDPVCANGVNGLAHIEYAFNGDATQGAQFAANQVLAAEG